jgi:N4-gp56 family major capsid protein
MAASTTPVLPTDPGARKAWSHYVGKEGAQRQYFSRMMGGEGSKAVIIKRSELQKGQGDEITTLITAKLQGAPRVGTERLEGTEKRITQFDTKIKIGLIREGVNVGSIMDEQRTGQQLGAIGREVLADWLAEYMEQFIHCHIAGTVGVGTCFTNVKDADGAFKKIEMPLLPIDDKHRLIGPAGNTAAGSLTDANILVLTTLTQAVRNKLSKFYGGNNGASKIEKANVGGKSLYVAALPTEVMADLKTDVGDNGWVAWQNALVRNMGAKAGPFVDGGGMYDNIVVDETPCGTYITGFGAGGAITAARSFVLGAGAVAFAQGRKGLNDGLTVQLDEDSDDRGHERVIHLKAIFDCTRVHYKDMAHAMLAIDTGFTRAPGGDI